MSKADVNSISLLKSIFTETRMHIPDYMKDEVVASLKELYKEGYFTDRDIMTMVKAGSLTPKDFTTITGNPYPADSSNGSGSSTPSTPSNSSTGSTGSNSSNGSNPSK